MVMATNGDAELEQRIRERAFRIWLEEGKPEGRHKQHWELAKLAIAREDGFAATLAPPTAPEPEPAPEPIEAVQSQGEFPMLVDQGEGLAPAERSSR
jgi:hypothetical protein